MNDLSHIEPNICFFQQCVLWRFYDSHLQTVDWPVHTESRNIFSYAKLMFIWVLIERAIVGNWFILSWSKICKINSALVIARIKAHVSPLVVTFDVRCYLCSIWIEQTRIDTYLMLESSIDLTTNYRETVTRNRFLTRNISHTKRFSDSREKRDSAREKRETSQGKRDWYCEKWDERW